MPADKYYNCFLKFGTHAAGMEYFLSFDFRHFACRCGDIHGRAIIEPIASECDTQLRDAADFRYMII